MLRELRLLWAFSLTTIVLLSACGSSSDSQLGGIDGSGSPVAVGTVSTGTINGFGSVIVNGVRYNSDKAKILVSDEISNEDNLHIGYQVKIIGATNADGSSIANTIEFHPNLVGVISQIDLVTQQFTLLNHQVQVNNATLFDAAIKPNFLSGLKIGDTVLVSGFVNDQGLVTATRVELTTSNIRQIMGYVSNLNPADFTFTLKGQSVNYSAASFKNLSANTIALHDRVVVTGTLNEKGILQAKTLIQINNHVDKTIKTVEAEGFVTRYTSASDFDVAGVTWISNAQTFFENNLRENLRLGVAVRIKGEANITGQLIAQKIEFKKSSTNEIVGEVTGITFANTTSIITGTLQINGTPIQTTATTAFEDKGSTKVKRFNMSSINVGDFLKISGYTHQGNFIATKIEREDIKDEKDTELKMDGIVANVGTDGFTLYGRTISINNKTEIKDGEGRKLTDVEFYLLALGQRVKVEGVLSNGVFVAQKIEIISTSDD